MGMSPQRRRYLETLCRRFRIDLIELLHGIQTGHPGGSLSATEVIVALYFEKMNVDPANVAAVSRDRFVLGKGHAAPMLYLVLAERGFFPKDDLQSLRQLGSHLQGHPCAGKTPGVEISTGSLGLGLSAGLGIALAGKVDGLDYMTYVLLGDGEIQEGIVWEAAMSAAKFNLDNLVAILDNNGVQLDGPIDEIMPLMDLRAKWEAFGWRVIEVDGHDVAAVCDAIDEAKCPTGRPTMIIANTVKGKGVSFMEGSCAWHGKPIDDDTCLQALSELKEASRA